MLQARSRHEGLKKNQPVACDESMGDLDEDSPADYDSEEESEEEKISDKSPSSIHRLPLTKAKESKVEDNYVDSIRQSLVIAGLEERKSRIQSKVQSLVLHDEDAFPFNGYCCSDKLVDYTEKLKLLSDREVPCLKFNYCIDTSLQDRDHYFATFQIIDGKRLVIQNLKPTDQA